MFFGIPKNHGFSDDAFCFTGKTRLTSLRRSRNPGTAFSYGTGHDGDGRSPESCGSHRAKSEITSAMPHANSLIFLLYIYD